MLKLIATRLSTMLLTMLCLSMVVFFLVNLDPNLRKLSISQTNMRATDVQIESWLQQAVARFKFCAESAEPVYAGILQGDFGCSTKFKKKVSERLFPALKATGWLMFWVMIVMVPAALIMGVLAGMREVMGVLAGMREGSRTDRTLSVAAITSTATPEYVSGIFFTVLFASWLGWLNGSAATATSKGITFTNFALPVMTMAIYGVGYIARMTRASMAEVMTSQYIRTARLKGLSFPAVVIR